MPSWFGEHVLELIKSLSLVSGTFVIVGVSDALAFAWARIPKAAAGR